MAMPTMNTQPFGGMPNAIPEPVDAVDLHTQRIREQLMQKRAQRDLQERAHIHANRPPLQDPEDFTKAVYKKPKGGTRGGQGNVPANGGHITGIPAPGTFKPSEVGPDGRLTPQAVWQRFHPNPLAGVTHGIPPGMSAEEFAQHQQSVRQQQLAAAAARHAAIEQMDAARRRGAPSTGYAYGASNSVPGSVDALLGHMNPNVGVGGGALLMHPPRQEGYGDMPGAIVPLNPALAAKQRLDRQRLRTSLGGRGHGALIEAGRPQLTQDEIDLENWRNAPGRMGSEVRGTLTPGEYKARRDDDLQSVKDRLATELQAKAARARMASDAGVANTPENLAALVRAGRMNRAAELASRKAKLAKAIEERRGTPGTPAAGDQSLPLVKIDPSLALWNPAAFNAAVSWNQGVLENKSREKLAGMTDARLREQGAAEREQLRQQHEEKLATINSGIEEARERGKLALAQNDRQAAEKAAADAKELEVLKRQTEESAARNRREEAEVKSPLERERDAIDVLTNTYAANGQPLPPDLVKQRNRIMQAIAGGHKDWASAAKAGILPFDKPGTGNAPEGSMTPQEKGDLITEAINSNRHDPYAAYEQMLEGNIPIPEAVAAINQGHPLITSGKYRFDPAAHDTVWSGSKTKPFLVPGGLFGWLAPKAFGPAVDWGTNSGWTDWLYPDALLPEEISNRKKGLVPR